MHSETVSLTGSPSRVDLPTRRRVEALGRRAASIYAVDLRRVLDARRGGPPVVRVRQIIMYLAHVGLGLSLTDVAALLGRSRAAVAHGCAVMEDMRDDPVFEALLEALEVGVGGNGGTER